MLIQNRDLWDLSSRVGGGFQSYQELPDVLSPKDQDPSLNAGPRHLPGTRFPPYIALLPYNSFRPPSECKGLRVSVRIRPRSRFC